MSNIIFYYKKGRKDASKSNPEAPWRIYREEKQIKENLAYWIGWNDYVDDPNYEIDDKTIEYIVESNYLDVYGENFVQKKNEDIKK